MTGDTPTEHIRRTDEGASIEVDITRGTGTRDQEKWKLKGKGATARQALKELTRMLEEVQGGVIADDRPLGDQVRQFQPEAGGDN